VHPLYIPAARSASVSDAKAPAQIEAVWVLTPSETRQLRMVCYRRNGKPSYQRQSTVALTQHLNGEVGTF